ncbi:MAG: InlB B-repeat-containing protein [Clostridia bacterium]|nr:InlB B-repeat-containing protein [Clostridia bacterium]
MKKLLALLLCAVMVIAVVPAVFAEGEFQIVVSSTSCDPGATSVSLTVSVVNNPGFFAMQLQRDFQAGITYKNCTAATGIIRTGTASTPNIVVESTIEDEDTGDQTDFTTDGKILTLRFDIPADAAPGDYTISFTVLSANNYALQYLTNDIVVVPGTIHVNGGGYDVGDFKGTETDPAAWTAPAETGKKFAGWYTDDTFGTVYDGTTGAAEPKFVDEKVMNVYAQASTTDNTVRFLSTIDACLAYQSVGFKVECTDQGNNWSVVKELSNVYSSVMESGVSKTASQISTTDDSAYITFAKLTNIPVMSDVKVTVTAFWKTPDGTTVWGNARDFYISCDGSSTTVTG